MILFGNYVEYKDRKNSIIDWIKSNGLQNIRGTYVNPKNPKMGNIVFAIGNRFVFFNSIPFLDFIHSNLLAVKHTIGKENEQNTTTIYDLYENQYCTIAHNQSLNIASANNIIHSNSNLPLLQLAKLISESKKHIFSKNKTFNEFKVAFNKEKQKKHILSKDEIEYYGDDIMKIIDMSYKDMGGHLGLQSLSDYFDNELEIVAMDTDSDPYIDIVRITKKKGKLRKGVAMGTDGEKENKKLLLDLVIQAMKSGKSISEVSGKLSEILIAKGVPVISEESQIEYLIGKKIDFIGHYEKDPTNTYGWYYRNIGGTKVAKLLMGKP